tara:strand:+ start:800 stop:2695 length:1896 start_codon:yes stop_codon:yes gene_type:complete
MINLNKLSLDFAGDSIFDNLSIQINKFDKIGLIGKNGAGKTTFLNLVSNKINPTSGSIIINKNIKISYLPQDLNYDSDVRLKEYVVGTKDELLKINNEIDLLNEKISNSNSQIEQLKLINDLEFYQIKQDKINPLNLEINSEKIMKGLGFTDLDFSKPINQFSGGWKMRAELSRLLLQEPDVLLLDEPTNHLDLPSIIWLEKFLNNTKCSIILVSHDIQFLDKNINRIFDISNSSIKDFKGNYSKYIIFRESEIDRQTKHKKNQDKYIKQANLLIDKFKYKKNKATFAQTLIRRLEKMDNIEVDEVDVSSINFQFPEPLHCGKIIFQLNDIQKKFGDKIIFNDLNLDVYKGDKIAFVGQNGCGKTTLTKIISGELISQGDCKIGNNVVINYFAQNQNELFDLNMSVLDYIENIPSSKTTSQLRGLLGSFLFTGDDVYKKIRVLSGGEKARLALCGLLLTPSNVLILDEPTNHLDMFAKDILKKALIEYEGTLILVSHDRDFLSDITDRVLEFTNFKIREFPGDINIYLDQYELIDEKSEKKKKGNKEKYLQQKEFKKKKRSLKKDNDIIENNIKSIEKKINEFNESLNDKSFNTEINYDDYDKLNNELQKEMKKWEEIQLKMEDLDFNDEW